MPAGSVIRIKLGHIKWPGLPDIYSNNFGSIEIHPGRVRPGWIFNIPENT